MTRKIKFPLIMNGVEIRSLEELKENFSAPQLLEYMENGKMVTWMRDRNLNDMAEQVQELKTEDLNSLVRLCEILDIPSEKAKEYIKNEAVRREKIHRLDGITDKVDEKLIDQVAFDQNELYKLLEEGQKEIYLCGDRFLIPLTKSGITYIGVNNPVAVIDSKEEVDWIKLDISLKDIVYDQKYQGILEEKRKREQISKTMVCMENRYLYKFDEENNRYVGFYKFKDLDMYYRNVAQDAKSVYLMREKGKFTGNYKIVSVSLEDFSETDLFDLPYKDPLDILCIRDGKLFLRGQYPKANKIIRIDVKTQKDEVYILPEHTSYVFIDEEGKNAYLSINNGPRSDQEIYRFNFKNQKKLNIVNSYNIHGMDLSGNYLMLWGKDTRKKAAEEYYYYIYNTRTERIQKYEGDNLLATKAIWKDERNEYRLAVIETHNMNEKYQLYKKDIITGSEKALCIINKSYFGTECMDKKMRLWKDYLYLYTRSRSEDSVNGAGKGIGYEVNRIPQYRIRVSDYKVQRYNGKIYENVLEWNPLYNPAYIFRK